MAPKRHRILLLLTLLILLKTTFSAARQRRQSGGQQRQQTKKTEPKELDYYSILGLSKKCKAKDIKSAYRKLALKYHPDKVPEAEREESEKKFIEVSEAYTVLSDEEKRKIYDKYGKIGLEAHERGADPSQFGGGGSPFEQGFGGNNGGGNFHFTFNGKPGGAGSGGFDPFMMFEQMFGGASNTEAFGGRQGAGNHFDEPGRHGGRMPHRESQVEELYPMKGSNTLVSRLGKSKFPDASSKHLWFIVFYKNEDPASQQVKKNIVKISEVFKNTVKVGAVNCGMKSQEERFCRSTLGTATAFPAYAMVVNGKVIPFELQSENVIPSTKDFHEFIMQHVPFDNIQNINRVDQLQTRLIDSLCKSDSSKGNTLLGSIFLLSDKFETSTLYASLAYSYRANWIFGESRAKNLVLAKEFGVKKYPMLVALIPEVDCSSKRNVSEGSRGYKVVTYAGEIKGDQITKWIDGLSHKLERNKHRKK